MLSLRASSFSGGSVRVWLICAAVRGQERAEACRIECIRAGLEGRARRVTVELRHAVAKASSWGTPLGTVPVVLLAAGRAEVSPTEALKASGEHTAAISVTASLQLAMAPELNSVLRVTSAAAVNGTGSCDLSCDAACAT